MIILSIPYYNETSLVDASAADWIEYRLDYAHRPDLIDFNSFAANTILTWRGLKPHSPQYSRFLASTAMIDIPFQHKEYLPQDTSKLIISLHLDDFDADKIRELLKLAVKPFSFKIVFEAKSFADILACKAIIDAHPGLPVIFNVSGKWAAFQRSLYPFFGSQAVYLFAHQSTHPGQLSFAKYRLIAGKGILAQSPICGIIGGEQVNESLSLYSFNRQFRSHYPLAHYLPIPASSAAEARSILLWLQKRFQLKLFSITSPFKTALPKHLSLGEDAINTLVFQPGHSFSFSLKSSVYTANYDIRALQDSLKRLGINKSHTIFIYGRSASAKAFFNTLQIEGYNKLLSASVDSPSSFKDEVDLLINASSRLSWEDEPGHILPKFKSLIELPYHRGKKSSLLEYALQAGLPHISAENFFEMQHSYQLKAFAAALNFDEYQELAFFCIT